MPTSSTSSSGRRGRARRPLLIAGAALLAPLLTCSPAPAQPAARASQATCEKQVQFALVDARTSGCLTKVASGPETWESTDTVNVNGIPLKAFPGTKLILTAPTSSAPGGSIAVGTKITLGGVTVFDGRLAQNLPAGGPGDLKTLASVSAPSGTKIKGFSLGGSVSIQLGRERTGDKQAYARFELIVKLPDVFRNGPDRSAGGLTGTVAIRTDEAGVHADTLKIEVTNAYVGQVLLKNVCLSYVSATSPSTPCSPPKFGATQLLECKTTGADRWDGSALIQLPTADKPELGVFAGTSAGQFAYAGAQVTNLGKSAPLAPGVYLDKAGIAICLNPAPMKIKGSVGIRFGPEFNGGSAAYLDGSMQYTDNRPWVLEANGKLKLFDKDVAQGKFTYRSDGAIDFGFDVSWNFYGLLDMSGGVTGWYQPTFTSSTYLLDTSDPANANRASGYLSCILVGICRGGRAALEAEYAKIPRRLVHNVEPTKFDVFGHGRVCAAGFLCLGGDMAVSNVGAAGCIEFTVAGYPEPYWFGVDWVDVKVRAGAGYRWGSGGVDVMGQSCDVGSYRAQKSAVIAAGGARRIRIARAPAVALKIAGHGGAPNVLITSPRGKRIVADRAGRLKRNDYLYLEDAKTDTTSIVISDPAPGTWSIRPLRGSPAIAAVSQAPVYPEPSIAGHVLGTGSSLTLEYALETSPGFAVTLWERGANYQQELGRAGGRPCLQNAPIQGTRPAHAFVTRPRITCGTIAFAPAPGPAGARQIVAVMTNHGEPVGEKTVTSYTASGEGLPAQPRALRITRAGTRARITWGRSPGAREYDVDVRLGDGASLLYVTRSRRRVVTVRGVGRREAVQVSVSALFADNTQGPAASARSAAS